LTLVIQKINTYTPEHYKLLLDADPSLKSIATYLSRSIAFELTDQKHPVGIIVVMPTEPLTVEIMNVAVKPEFQDQYLGSRLIQFVVDHFNDDPDFTTLTIKTGTTSFKQLYLYQKLGFRCTTILTDYFQNQEIYPKDIYENKMLLRDAVLLQRELKA
jgi:ribosomal protein S18 acetylase RimI-like enzyme